MAVHIPFVIDYDNLYQCLTQIHFPLNNSAAHMKPWQTSSHKQGHIRTEFIKEMGGRHESRSPWLRFHKWPLLVLILNTTAQEDDITPSLLSCVQREPKRRFAREHDRDKRNNTV